MFGDCGGRHLRRGCWLERHELEREQRLQRQRETRFYCPNCESHRKRRWLWADEPGFCCRECASAYTVPELRERYQGELADLINDADYVRSVMAGLDAWE